MILRFNILQTILGLGCLICSLAGYGVAYLFFRWMKKIDFSIAKGDARFRAFPDYGA